MRSVFFESWQGGQLSERRRHGRSAQEVRDWNGSVQVRSAPSFSFLRKNEIPKIQLLEPTNEVSGRKKGEQCGAFLGQDSPFQAPPSWLRFPRRLRSLSATSCCRFPKNAPHCSPFLGTVHCVSSPTRAIRMPVKLKKRLLS